MFVSSCSSFFIFTVTSHIAYFPFCVSTFTCVAPVAFPVTVPSSETVAMFELLLFQLNKLYTFDVSGLIVAISFWYVEISELISILVLSKTTAVGLVCTITLQVAIFPFPVFAVIVASPFEIPVIIPSSDTVATLGLLVFQLIFV